MARDPRSIGEDGIGGEQQGEEQQDVAIRIYVENRVAAGEAMDPGERLHLAIARPRPTSPPFVVRTIQETDAAIIKRKMSGPDIEQLKKRALAKALIAEAALMGALKVVKIGDVPDLEPDMQAWAAFAVGKRKRHWFRIERDPAKDNPREYVIFSCEPPPHGPDGPVGGDGKSGDGSGRTPGGGTRGGNGSRRGKGVAGGKRKRLQANSRSALILYKFLRSRARRWISGAKAEFLSRSHDSFAWLRRAAGNVVRILYGLDATILDVSQNYLRRASRVHAVFTHLEQLPAEGFGSGAVLTPRLVGDRIGLSLLLFSFAADEEIDWSAHLFGVDWSQNLFGAPSQEGPMAA
jgi:hypothetical protein